MKIVGPFLFLFLFLPLASQITFIVNKIPANTPSGDKIYVAGNFNGWNPGDAGFRLTEDDSGRWYGTFNIGGGNIEYKFTRGSWATVEGSSTGGFIPNRKAQVSPGDTLRHMIAGWENQSGGQSTAAGNVHILTDSFYMPQLQRFRRIWVYLPPDYDSSSRYYPVLYMHDGQNLFDRQTSFSGEWEVDESLNLLFDDGDPGVIVVGVDNGGTRRIDEYSPWHNAQYGGGEGALYSKFIVNTLKPFIDSAYRTRSDRQHTGIAGSSMGGLISLYSGLEYTDVFGKLGVFSPSLWFSNDLWTWLDSVQIRPETKIYLLAGGKEGASLMTKIMRCDSILQSKGISRDSIFLRIDPQGSHNEAFWRKYFPEAYLFLFRNGSPASGVSNLHSERIIIAPNPASDFIQWKIPYSGIDTVDIIVYNMQGEALIQSRQAIRAPLDIGKLPSGTYQVLLISDSRVWSGRFVKN